MIYFFLLSVLSLFALIHVYVTDKKQLVFANLIAILLILIIGGLRFEVGADWFAYANLFNGLDSLSVLLNAREEKLFLFTFYFIRFFTSNYSIAVFLFFTLSFLIKVKVINKYSPNAFLSLIIYISAIFLIYDLNGIRQGIALGFVLLSIPAILERKLWQFFLIVITAIFFHTSAIIFVPFYWIANKEISIKRMLIYSSLILLLSIPISAFMLSNPLFTFLLTTDSLKHYNFYLADRESNKSVEIISIAVFQRVLILGLILYNYKKIKMDEGIKRLLINAYFISFVVFIFFSFSSEFAARLGFYYKSTEMILLPMIVAAQNKRYLKIIYLAIFIGLAFLATKRLLSVEDNGLIPFRLFPFFS